MTSGPLRLSVVIPHYNDVVRLEKCLVSLKPQLAVSSGVEAVVVDNDSPCDLAPLKEAFPQIRFVTEPLKGAAAARNRGAAETTAPYIAFIDSDCVAASDWLETALGLARADTIFGGRVDTFDETPAPRSGAEAFETVFAFHQKAYIAQKGFSVTANLVTPRAIFEDVGPLIVGLSEDMDWCFRATAKGYALVYADDLRVSHPTRSDWSALAKKWRRTTNEMFHLNGTSSGARVKWALRAGAVLLSGPAHLPKVFRSKKLSSALERRRAAVMLLRLRLTRAGWMLRQALGGH